MALTTDARLELADALRAAGVACFPSAPETLTLPSVVLVPAEPYVRPSRIGNVLSYKASWELTCIAQAADNAAGLGGVEQLVDAVLEALPDGFTWELVSRPMLDVFGAQGAGYVAQITVTAQVRKD
jgi:hypothetical protein